MKIILVAIHPDTTKQDIHQFIEPVLEGGLFSRKGVIENIEIKTLYDNKAKTMERHGLVTVNPDQAANRIIKKLHRKALKGKYIAVREYHIRSWHNDPRLKSASDELDFADRRTAERRRYYLQAVNHVEVGFTGYESFSRSYEY